MKNKNLRDKFSKLKMKSNTEMESLNDSLLTQIKGGKSVAVLSGINASGCNGSGCNGSGCGVPPKDTIIIIIRR